MLRLRDVLAILAALVLTRMAYNDPSDSIAATVHLSFYVGVEGPTISTVASSKEKDETSSGGSGGSGAGDRLSLPPAVFDVDGDGAGEALVTVMQKPNGDSMMNTARTNNASSSSSTSPPTDARIYQIKVLDLKPAGASFTSDKTHIAPFRPKVLYESLPFEFSAASDAHPSGMATGQVLLKSSRGAAAAASGRGRSRSAAASTRSMYEYKGTLLTDNNRKYFCGNSWHEASELCAHPCPSGQPNDCPEGMRCFADTPCDVETFQKDSEQEQAIGKFLVTPAGGLPSIFVLWTNGEVTMHSLTGDDPNNGTATTTTTTTATNAAARKRRRQAGLDRLLSLREMWRTSVFSQFIDTNNTTVFNQLVDETITFIDGVDAGYNHGIVVIQAYVLYQSNEGKHRVTMPIVALDAKTGKMLWDSSIWDDKEEEDASFPLPMMQHGTTSSARRRSLIPDLDHRKGKATVPNCMLAYRRSMLTSDGALPFLYWVAGDSSLQALHFDHQLHHKKSHARAEKLAPRKRLAPGAAVGGGGVSGGATGGAAGTVGGIKALGKYSDKIGFLKNILIPGARKRHRHHKRHSLKLGRPNVVVSKIYNGLQVRSLRNGEALCHLTLWEETLFADINHDGVLDTVQLLTGDYSHDEQLSAEEQWIARLVRRVSGMSEDSASEEVKEAKTFQNLCHVLALSGVPTKEELFSVNICGSNFYQDNPNTHVEAAPPMVVEASRGGKGHDVVVAVSVGKVLRIRNTGRRQWQTQGKFTPDFPTWMDDSKVLLARIDDPNVMAASRPIILAGENSLVLLSSDRGTVMSTATFPQPTIGRPILADFNGDGTTDVMVMTADAVWGYHVSVRTGSSVLFRVAVGLLLMGMMLAVLRNRFGPYPGKRSTDA